MTPEQAAGVNYLYPEDEGAAIDAEILALESELGATDDAQVGSAMDAEIAALEAELGQQPQDQSSWVGRQADALSDFAGGALVGAADTASFGAGDELMAAAQAWPALLTDKATFKDFYDKALTQGRGEQNAIQERNPVAYGTGQVAGAILPGSGLVSGGAKLASKMPKTMGFLNAARVPTAAGRLAVRSAPAAGAGAVSGGVYGYASGTGGNEQRSENAQSGALIGGALSPVGVAAGRVLSPLAARAMKAFRSIGKSAPEVATTSVREIAETATKPALPAVSSGQEVQALGKVEQSLRQAFPDEMQYQSALQAYKQGDESLVELASAPLRNRAKGAAQFPSGQQRAEQFFDEKMSGVGARAEQAIAKNVSGTKAFYATIDDIFEAGRKKAKPFYDKSESVVIDEASPVLQTPEIKTALAAARRKYPSELKDFPDNSIKALDYTKRVIDDQIGEAERKGQGNFVRSRRSIKNDLVEVMDEASPDYKKARAESGDYLSLTKAMDDGLGFDSLDPELLAKNYAKLTDAEKNAFKSGVAKSLYNKIDKGGNPYKQTMGDPAKTKRLTKILSPAEYKKLDSDMKAEDRLFKIRNEVLGGSPSVSKAVAAADIAGASDEIVSIASGGGALGAAKSGIVSVIKKRLSGLSDETAGRISDILYETDPQKKLYIIENLGKGKGLSRDEAKRAQAIALQLEKEFKKRRTQDAVLPMGGTSETNKKPVLPEVELPRANFTPTIE